MEWWESAEEYNPGMSLWRGRKISNDTSCESDIEIIEEKAAPKDESIKVCRRNLFTFSCARKRCESVMTLTKLQFNDLLFIVLCDLIFLHEHSSSKGYFVHTKNQIVPVL